MIRGWPSLKVIADCSSLIPPASVASVKVIGPLALSLSLLCACCVPVAPLLGL